MTAIRNTFMVIWCLIYSACVCGCVTETTRTITTDKAGTVTDTTVTRKGTDPAALKLVEVAAAVYVPRRPIVIREDKADHDMKRLLRGRPITELEIAFRWKPLLP